MYIYTVRLCEGRFHRAVMHIIQVEMTKVVHKNSISTFIYGVGVMAMWTGEISVRLGPTTTKEGSDWLPGLPPLVRTLGDILSVYRSPHNRLIS